MADSVLVEHIHVERSCRRHLWWDPHTLREWERHFTSWIERRENGERGPSRCLNRIVYAGMRDHADPRSDLIAGGHRIPVVAQARGGVRERCYWNRELVWEPLTNPVDGYWVTYLEGERGKSPYIEGWSQWVNELVALQLIAWEPAKAAHQHLPGIPEALPRPRRVAHQPLGWTDQRRPPDPGVEQLSLY